MTTELWMLLYTTLLFMMLLGAQTIISLASGISVQTLAGDRSDLPAAEGLRGRMDRTVNNSVEGMVIFVPLVVIAHLAGVSNEMTAMGATIYFWSRVAFVPLYLFGIPWVRTIVFLIGLIGLIMIAAAIFGIGG
jgi:uncharacterized MAPEG superfamily protein